MSVTLMCGMFLIDFSTFSFEDLSKIIKEFNISNFFKMIFISLVFLIFDWKLLKTTKLLFLFFSLIRDAILCFFSVLFNFLFLYANSPFGPWATPPPTNIYAQKGTGNARHASKKAPIFVGGGVAHGPKGELNYKKRKLNKSEKKLSIASLITKKNKLNDLIILNDFQKEIPKTKEMNKILIKFDAKNSIIIADKNSKDNILKSTRNIPNVKITDVNHFSAYDLAKFKKVIFTETSIKELEKRY